MPPGPANPAPAGSAPVGGLGRIGRRDANPDQPIALGEWTRFATGQAARRGPAPFAVVAHIDALGLRRVEPHADDERLGDLRRLDLQVVPRGPPALEPGVGELELGDHLELLVAEV